MSKISGDSITGYEYNGLNQLMKMGSATPELSETITVTGTVTDAQSVTVNGLNAPISNGEYSRDIELAGGWNTINVTATSAAGKQAHRSVDVFLAGDSTIFSYDNNGNMTHKTDTTGTINYGYDLADRLISITYPDSRPATSYTYNGRNKKVSQTIGTDVTRYLWDGDQIIRELDGEGQTRATLVHGLGLGADIGSLVKAERSGQGQYFNYDWRGSVTALTDQTAQTVQTYLYDAFGNVTDSSGSAVNPYQFSSKMFDSNSGFSYFGRRHYSSSLGRFSTQDPKEYVDGLNTYAYVKNNPVNFVDLFGFCSMIIIDAYASVWIDPVINYLVMISVETGYPEGTEITCELMGGGGSETLTAAVDNSGNARMTHGFVGDVLPSDKFPPDVEIEIECSGPDGESDSTTLGPIDINKYP